MGLFCKLHLFSVIFIFSSTVANCGFLENFFNYDPKKDLSLTNKNFKDLEMPRNDIVRFFLYPNKGPMNNHEEIIVGNAETLRSYDSTIPPIIVIHGFMQNYQSKHVQKLKDAYRSMNYPANIILVDWNKVSQPSYGYTLNLVLGYPLAIKYVDSFAKQIADLILFLVQNGAVPDPSYVHIVGFSLGGQIAGVTGSKVKKATGGAKIGRITGLDPAGLNYHLKLNQESKLDRNDADFVDVIHTAILKYGYILPIGHVDFYPNGGGPSQPNCKVPLDSKRDLPGLPGSCAHARSWDYFTSSIYNENIVACKDVNYGDYKSQNICQEPIIFGQYIPRSARGVYFLEAVVND